METNIGVVKKSQYRTSQWSGGTTTELLIYPVDSSYSERSFKWRISSAEVEASESAFTSLPGITRHIMVTDGRIILEHENRYRKVLGTFSAGQFYGRLENCQSREGNGFQSDAGGRVHRKAGGLFSLKKENRLK